MAESLAVDPSTEQNYKIRVGAFESWTTQQGLTLDWTGPAPLVEQVMLEYIDYLMVDKLAAPEEGSKLVASVGHIFPRFYREAKYGMLRRVGRALKGWTKVMPGQTLLPWPAMAIAGICNRLMLKKKQRLALTGFVAMDEYLRPGVGISLKRFNLAPPQETDAGVFKY